MTAPPEAGAPSDAGAARALAVSAGAFAGFVFLAITNAIAIAVTLPLPRAAWLRVPHHAFDLAQMLGLGLLAATPLGLWAWGLGGRVALSLTAYAALATAGMHVVLGRDLERQALVAFDGDFARTLTATFTVLCGLALPAAHIVGTWLARFRRLRFVPVAIAVGGVATNHAILRDDYPGLHAAIAWTAATLLGAAVATHAARIARAALARRGGRVALAAVAIVAALGLAVPPSNAVRLELFREPGATGAWLLASTVWSLPRAPEPATPPPWLAPRDAPSAPTDPPLLRAPPVVVLITIDAMRADAIADAAHDAQLPTLARMKRQGAHFTRATTPGSQTSVSLSTVFAGRYFSEMYWSMHGVGAARFDYAAADTSARFPALLAERGVSTESYCSINFLAGDFGVVRGFASEKMIARGREHAPARDVVAPLLDRLRRAKPKEALFLFAHLTEPHAPYDRGGVKTGPDHDRYLAEIAVADAQLARIAKVLEQRFPDRGVLIVTSDHGEAFGEHETLFHTKTLYEELLRVPLLVKGPGVARRAIHQHVGVIDLGPTILDLFGVETPPSFMGQSLVPLLAGGTATLTRPILAEGRLRRAIYEGDIKAIVDDRRKVVEAYDLAADPGETHNLFDTDPARVEPALASLRAFFEARAYTKDGYRPPYKP